MFRCHFEAVFEKGLTMLSYASSFVIRHVLRMVRATNSHHMWTAMAATSGELPTTMVTLGGANYRAQR